MSALTVTNLNVTYGNTTAVKDATFELAEGELVAVVGASGSGKSSMLAAIAGIVAYSGSVSWKGQDLADVPVHRRGVGMVFQDGQLFPHRSVARNVSFGLEMARWDAGTMRERVAEVLGLVGLAALGERSVDELSGGERQRVALARALAPLPRVLLMDEPLSSLDADLRGRLAVEVRDLLADQGVTGILVTHDRTEAKTMSSRLMVMAEGVLTAAEH